MTIIYTAKAEATGGRDGHAKTDDGKIDAALSLPGSNGAGTNPEQFFAAGYAACFGQALKAMSDKEGLKPAKVSVHATVNLHKGDDGFKISVALNSYLEGLSQAEAEKIVDLSHQICPYSKATRGNIDVALLVNGTAFKQAA
jgi:Ohr subfamily peroxiredoxin